MKFLVYFKKHFKKEFPEQIVCLPVSVRRRLYSELDPISQAFLN